MQKICLIVNPISGGKDKKQLVQTILEHLDHQKYTAEVAWTQHAGHGAVDGCFGNTAFLHGMDEMGIGLSAEIDINARR
jgi:hypothetical protein